MDDDANISWQKVYNFNYWKKGLLMKIVKPVFGGSGHVAAYFTLVLLPCRNGVCWSIQESLGGVYASCIRDLWSNVSGSDGLPMASLAEGSVINGRSMYNLPGLYLVSYFFL